MVEGRSGSTARRDDDGRVADPAQTRPDRDGAIVGAARPASQPRRHHRSGGQLMARVTPEFTAGELARNAIDTLYGADHCAKCTLAWAMYRAAAAYEGKRYAEAVR